MEAPHGGEVDGDDAGRARTVSGRDARTLGLRIWCGERDDVGTEAELMMETIVEREVAPCPGGDPAWLEQPAGGEMMDCETLERMSLEELLYYVLVGDGSRQG